ncbi:hypothetical protein HEQ75_27550, partial [Roseomonas sp. BU-1]|nr:hypothetical protein [Falsiroseomonas selenitidurans]
DVSGSAGDQLIGGAGNDTVSYEWDSVGVFVHLGMDLASHDDGDDTLSGFENAIGGSGNDEIHGSDDANSLAGGDGNDSLSGGDGNDTLDGGEGNNLLDGGEGLDLLDYGAAVADSVIFATLTSELTRYDAYACTLGTDTLSGIETLVATEGGQDMIDGAAEVARALAIDLGAETLVVTGLSGVESSMTVQGFEHASGGLGDDLLTGSAGANILGGGGGADTLAGGAGADTLDGGDGTDTADYTTSGAAVRFYLTGGAGTGVGGDAEGDALSSIENITGSAHNDTLHGDEGANLLFGGAGDDTLAGGGGADTLQGSFGDDVFLIGSAAQHAVGEMIRGGDGNDVIRFTSTTAAETLVLTSGVGGVEEVRIGDASGDVSGSTALNIDAAALGSGAAIRLVGNAGSNLLTGNDNGASHLIGGAGNDTLVGGSGADTLVGGSGADSMAGGSGSDWVDYSGSVDGISVNLKDAVQALGDAQDDTLVGVENVLGSAAADFIRGDAAANQLIGGAGNDSLQGFEGNDTLEGGAGADELIGGTGTDLVTYRGAAAGVVVDLTLTLTAQGDAEGDTFLGIENLEGSAHGDTLVGDGQANLLTGGDGNDALTGGAGNDTLTGGAGRDMLTGGTGADRYVWTSVSDSAATTAERDCILDWGAGDRIDLSALDANLDLGGLQNFVFRGVTSALYTAEAGELWSYQYGSKTYLIGGVDADTGRDFQI